MFNTESDFDPQLDCTRRDIRKVYLMAEGNNISMVRCIDQNLHQGIGKCRIHSAYRLSRLQYVGGWQWGRRIPLQCHRAPPHQCYHRILYHVHTSRYNDWRHQTSSFLGNLLFRYPITRPIPSSRTWRTYSIKKNLYTRAELPKLV